jgi:hypothetical protein
MDGEDKMDNFIPMTDRTENFKPITDKMTFDLETDRYIGAS